MTREFASVSSRARCRYSETETHQLIEDAPRHTEVALAERNRPASRLHVARTTRRRSGKALLTAEAQATQDDTRARACDSMIEQAHAEAALIRTASGRD